MGTLPIVEGQVLLCRRAIEPGYGMWTLPAGFMENGESMAQGAARETLEEACAPVKIIEPVFSLVDIPHIGQIHVFFRAQLGSEYAAGEETLEVKLFEPAEIPWDDIAFNSVKWTLRKWIRDLVSQTYPTEHHTHSPHSID